MPLWLVCSCTHDRPRIDIYVIIQFMLGYQFEFNPFFCIDATFIGQLKRRIIWIFFALLVFKFR